MITFAGLIGLGLVLGRTVSVLGMCAGVIGLVAGAILIHLMYGTDMRIDVLMFAANQICFQASYLAGVVIPRCALRA